jgi:hypothetical protein
MVRAGRLAGHADRPAAHPRRRRIRCCPRACRVHPPAGSREAGVGPTKGPGCRSRHGSRRDRRRHFPPCPSDRRWHCASPPVAFGVEARQRHHSASRRRPGRRRRIRSGRPAHGSAGNDFVEGVGGHHTDLACVGRVLLRRDDCRTRPPVGSCLRRADTHDDTAHDDSTTHPLPHDRGDNRSHSDDIAPHPDRHHPARRQPPGDVTTWCHSCNRRPIPPTRRLQNQTLPVTRSGGSSRPEVWRGVRCAR